MVYSWMAPPSVLASVFHLSSSRKLQKITSVINDIFKKDRVKKTQMINLKLFLLYHRNTDDTCIGYSVSDRCPKVFFGGTHRFAIPLQLE